MVENRQIERQSFKCCSGVWVPFIIVISFHVLFVHAEESFCPKGKPIIPRNFDKPRMFEDLTPNEMKTIRDYMLSDEALNLKPYDKATLDSSYIYLIDLLLPNKSLAIEYLDEGKTEPERSAIVIVYRGDMEPPRVEEYEVGPLPNPTFRKLADKRSFTRAPIPFTSRPVDMIEYDHLYALLAEIGKQLYPVFKESYGLSYHNCTKGVDCLVFTDVTPRGISSNERSSWFWSFRDAEGYYLHPLGFELQIDHRSVNVSEWSVKKVVYNGQMYDSVKSFYDQYKTNSLKKISLHMDQKEALYSSYQRRGPHEYDVPVRGPHFVEPDGRRFSVDGQHVQYFGWKMDFRVRTSTGLQLFDVRFQGERIAYEISLQDAIVYYTGYGPAAGSTAYYDTSVLMGACLFELMPGADCPATASFHDAYHFAAAGEPSLYKNAICIFEHNAGVPLRRHYSNNYQGGYDFYGGTVDNVLVIRTIANIGNYDYVFDYIFHLNGAIEIKASLTGYVQSTFALPEEEAYGNYMHDGVIATLHQHLFNYKVDLDIAGTSNRYATLGISTETVPNPWYPGFNKTQMMFSKADKLTEKEGVWKFDFNKPSYHIIYNSKSENKYGAKRAYRIDHRAMTPFVLERVDVTLAADWARYQMAVTRYHDWEKTSTSIYAQNDPFDPVLDFSTFLSNDESIVDEDLVLWLTAGALHIPDSEDVPSTTTAGNQYNIFLRPYNFFDECPSTVVSDSVHAVPSNDYRKVCINTFGVREGAKCFANETPFEIFNGSRPLV